MAVHRYWRLKINTVNSGSFAGISELGFYDATFANQTTGTAFASTFYAPENLIPANAFDNNPATVWASDGSAFPQYLGMDYGAGIAKDIVSFGVQARNSGNTVSSSQAPSAFELQYSDDGTTYTTLYNVTGQTGWSTWDEIRFFNASGTALYDQPPAAAYGTTKRFWRLHSTAADGGVVVGMNELVMRTAPGGANQCTGGTGYADATSEGAIVNLFDGVTSGQFTTQWVGGAQRGYAGYMFATAKDIVEAAVTARNGFQTQSPKAFTIDYWNNGSWTTAFTAINETGWTDNQTRTYTWGTGPAATARPVVCVSC